MPSVNNKTNKPLTIPLPRGKRLHLAAGKSAQISPKAVDHAPLLKLVEAGEIEISDGRGPAAGNSGLKQGRSSNPGHRGAGGIRHTGDR